ncbi:flagellar biosynthetic protein FliO, partial [Methylobacterium radiotolerans]
LRRRVRHRNDPLRGSILSPDTWRQTAEALRRAR